MPLRLFPASVLIFWIWCGNISALSLPRSKELSRFSGEVARHSANAEPSCEELKAMWRFSKRQSRAAEISNEIPLFKDPFLENVWEPYFASSRSMGGVRIGGRYRNRPIFGRVVHKAPFLRLSEAERNKAFEELAQSYGRVQPMEQPRRQTAFRVSGGHIPLPRQTGSFQHLKELIQTERARELQEQRLAEEVAARTAVMKELAGKGHRKHSDYNAMDAFNYEDEDMDDYGGQQPHLSRDGGLFPAPSDLFAAPIPREREPVERFIHDNVKAAAIGYQRNRPRSFAGIYGGSSSFNMDDYDGFGV